MMDSRVHLMLHLTKTKLKHDGGMFDSLPCASDDEDAVFVMFVSSLELLGAFSGHCETPRRFDDSSSPHLLLVAVYDCEVSPWSDWAECATPEKGSCGMGTQRREREVSCDWSTRAT